MLILKGSEVCDTGVLDHVATKWSALNLATEVAITILRISQIIMAKGGTTLPGGGGSGTMGSMDQDD